MISVVRGGKALGGFLSGFAGSLFGGFAKDLDNVDTITKTIMVAVAGGTASVLGGGKFANGAMSAAFVFMFNDLYNNGTSIRANNTSSRQFREAHPNSFSVHVHGNSSGIEYRGKWYGANQIDDFKELLLSNGWDGKQDIILFSCNTGKGVDSFAYNLSTDLGVTVYAPNNYYSVPQEPVIFLFQAQGIVTSDNLLYNVLRIPSGSMIKF